MMHAKEKNHNNFCMSPPNPPPPKKKISGGKNRQMMMIMMVTIIILQKQLTCRSDTLVAVLFITQNSFSEVWEDDGTEIRTEDIFDQKKYEDFRAYKANAMIFLAQSTKPFPTGKLLQP